ncbi:hypothetical protein DSCA_62070 [Desulfosarcina alkanivorans]|uniref:Uncharacterized protein n=1 Tax=Desulfosarcina alkanivorans TaxID=571177 RepID=A0A5K7Z6Z3_9BACT|nr:hypothetical protein DSCA_62070 [Desulfosarcina alkanivorans]
MLYLITIGDPSVGSHQAGGQFMAEKENQQQQAEQRTADPEPLICFSCFHITSPGDKMGKERSPVSAVRQRRNTGEDPAFQKLQGGAAAG